MQTRAFTASRSGTASSLAAGAWPMRPLLPVRSDGDGRELLHDASIFRDEVLAVDRNAGRVLLERGRVQKCDLLGRRIEVVDAQLDDVFVGVPEVKAGGRPVIGGAVRVHPMVA